MKTKGKIATASAIAGVAIISAIPAVSKSDNNLTLPMYALGITGVFFAGNFAVAHLLRDEGRISNMLRKMRDEIRAENEE